MQFVPFAAVTAVLGMSLMNPQVQAQSPTSARRTASGTVAQRRGLASAQAMPQAGLAAVGSMPAVAGPAKTLFAMRYVDLKLGTGELAQTHKFYTVHYTGWTLDGQKFDSSFDHDGQEPIVFPVGARQVIVGWDTGFEGMRIGGKRRLIVPYQLAYGELGRPPIPPKADLIFDVELLAQSDAPPQKQPVAPVSSPGAGTPQQNPASQPGTNPVTAPSDSTSRPR